MCRLYPLALAVVINLSVVSSNSVDLQKAFGRIENDLQHIKQVIYSSYIGCFRDTPKRVLKGYKLKGDAAMTKEKCVSLCQKRNYKYAGLQFANECFCGKHLVSTRCQEKECSMRCSGNKQQICGGGYRMSVYRIH